MNATVKPDAAKPAELSAKDRPVTPAEAVDHLHGTVKAIQGKVRPQVPNYAEGSVELSDARTIRNGTLSSISTTLTTPSKDAGKNEKTGFTVRGHEDPAGQKREPTTITMNSDGQRTTFALGRDDAGRIKATEVLSPEQQQAGAQPRTLGQAIVDKVKNVPPSHFTQEGQKRVREQALGVEHAVDERNRIEDAKRAQANKVAKEGGLPKGVPGEGQLEGADAVGKRVAQQRDIEASKPDVTGIKAATSTVQVGKNFHQQGRRQGPGTGNSF